MLVKLQTEKCKSAAILYISMHVPNINFDSSGGKLYWGGEK